MSFERPLLPSGWEWSRIDRVAAVSARIGWKALTAAEYVPEGYTFLSTPNIKSDTIDFQNVNYITEWRYLESPELMLQLGDVLLVKDGNTLGITNVIRTLPGPATVNGSIAILRPGRIEPRYLRYVLASDMTQGLIASLRAGMGVPHLFQADIKKMPVPLPPRSMQGAIADYLDTETARIDALIERKNRMAALVREQFVALAESTILAEGALMGPLMHSTDPYRPIMYGIVLPGPNVETGVPIVKGGDVAARRLDPDSLNRTTEEIEAPYARARLAPDDLVFAIRGGIGDVGIVPAPLAGANITQDVARVAPAASVDSRWLCLVLRTAFVQSQVEARTTGATIKGLNIWDLKRVIVPMSDPKRQNSDLAVLKPAMDRADRTANALVLQVQLLREHRQALITAAVTGGLQVRGVAA